MESRKQLVLASGSPRRVALLRQIGLNPHVVPSSIEEVVDTRISPSDNATELALRKAVEVGARFNVAYVVGADTIVVLDGRMIGKPADGEEAFRMLTLLSGRTHTVVTGFAIVDRPSDRHVTAVEATSVTFRELPADEIREYVSTGAPLDKAGAYGIQDDYGAVFATRIEGCFYNVVGFPLSRFYTTFRQFVSTTE